MLTTQNIPGVTNLDFDISQLYFTENFTDILLFKLQCAKNVVSNINQLKVYSTEASTISSK